MMGVGINNIEQAVHTVLTNLLILILSIFLEHPFRDLCVHTESTGLSKLQVTGGLLTLSRQKKRSRFAKFCTGIL